jgi:hypothetical protein
MSTRSTDGLTAGPTTNRGRIRLIVFRVLGAVAGLFFLVAVVLAVPAPWVVLQPEDPNAAENRWFLTVAGSVDAIAVVMFFALVQRPRRTLLFVEMSAAAVIAATIILPLDCCSLPSLPWPSCRLSLTRTGGTPGHSHPGGPACRGPHLSSPRSPESRCWWRLSSPCFARLAERTRRLRRTGGWIMRSTPRYKPSPECSPPAADPAGASSGTPVLRSGSTLGLLPRWSFRTTPDRGVTSAVSPQSLVGLGFALAVWRGVEQRKPRSLRQRTSS